MGGRENRPAKFLRFLLTHRDNYCSSVTGSRPLWLRLDGGALIRVACAIMPLAEMRAPSSEKLVAARCSRTQLSVLATVALAISLLLVKTYESDTRRSELIAARAAGRAGPAPDVAPKLVAAVEDTSSYFDGREDTTAAVVSSSLVAAVEEEDATDPKSPAAPDHAVVAQHEAASSSPSSSSEGTIGDEVATAMPIPTFPPGVALGVLSYRATSPSSSNIGDWYQSGAALFSWWALLNGSLDRPNTGSPPAGTPSTGSDFASFLNHSISGGDAVGNWPRVIWMERDGFSSTALPPPGITAAVIVMNGWFMRKTARDAESGNPSFGFPPPDWVIPIFVSFHIADLTLLKQKGVVPYLRAHAATQGPIGARDYPTRDALLAVRVPAYFTGCITPLLRLSGEGCEGGLDTSPGGWKGDDMGSGSASSAAGSASSSAAGSAVVDGEEEDEEEGAEEDTTTAVEAGESGGRRRSLGSASSSSRIMRSTTSRGSSRIIGSGSGANYSIGTCSIDAPSGWAKGGTIDPATGLSVPKFNHVFGQRPNGVPVESSVHPEWLFSTLRRYCSVYRWCSAVR